MPKLASGFGGGIGRKGSLCGAFTAGVMAIGIKFGRTDAEDKERLAEVYDKVRQFWEDFEKEFGSRDCYALTGCHLDDPEENARWHTTGGREKCTGIVTKAAGMVYEIIEKE